MTGFFGSLGRESISALTTLANIGVLAETVAVVYELDQNTSAIVGSTQQGLFELIGQSVSWLQDKEFPGIAYRAEEQKEILTGLHVAVQNEWK